jgi:hypothetical protein
LSVATKNCKYFKPIHKTIQEGIVDEMIEKFNLRRFFKSQQISIIAITIGCVCAIVFVGPLNIFPWNTAWLNNKGDGSAAQLIWRFYQQSPMLQWPITALPNYVSGANTVNPDGNAIFAVGAKFIGLFVPGQFQYFGILIVLWFSLQALFAERLLSRFTESRAIRLLGMSFFLLSPAFVYRLGSMRHFHVAAHWLILAAFYLYFDRNFRRILWSILLAIAVAINIYISVIVAAIFVSSVWRTVLERKYGRLLEAISGITKMTAMPALAAAVSFIISGYASYSDSAVGSGFFHLNPLAFVNPGYSPSGSFSLMVNTIFPLTIRNLFAEEWEGFQYIGLGVVLLLPIFCLSVWRSRNSLLKTRWMPIGVVSILLFFFALSNQITFAHLELNYWWPNAFLYLREVFRGASRFGFALYYLIMLGSIVSVLRTFTKNTAAIILAVLLTVSLVDQYSGLRQSQKDLSAIAPIETRLRDSEWSQISKIHSRLVIDKNFDLQVEGAVPISARVFSENWFLLASFAVDHQLSTNFGYVSRPIQAFIKEEDQRVAEELSSGKLDRNTIYLISNEKDWTRYRELVGDKGRALILDGFFVIIGQ